MSIQYAFAYPNRLENSYSRLDFFDLANLSFERPDLNKFRNLGFAYEALKRGGNMACIINASNEVVVSAFLQGKIGFLQMSDVIEFAMNKVPFIEKPTYEDYVATDSKRVN